MRCRKCGAVPMLVGKQYSVRCHACGTRITVTPNFLARLKEREARARYGEGRPVYRCSICQDRGYVIVEQQVNDYLYDFLYRCLCSNGQNLESLAGVPVLPPQLAGGKGSET